jgi:pyruvate dehydrogenase E1 component
MNENYEQPTLPAAVRASVIKGMYLFGQYPPSPGKDLPCVDLLGSGAIFREVIAAAEILAREWCVAANVYSVTSFSELARDAREVERFNRLHPVEVPKQSHLSQCLTGNPIVVATDYVCAYPQLIAAYVPARFLALGTDGFGRSDTRAALRRFFEVDRYHVVIAALHVLAEENKMPRARVAEALARYQIAADARPPWAL